MNVNTVCEVVNTVLELTRKDMRSILVLRGSKRCPAKSRGVAGARSPQVPELLPQLHVVAAHHSHGQDTEALAVLDDLTPN